MGWINFVDTHCGLFLEHAGSVFGCLEAIISIIIGVSFLYQNKEWCGVLERILRPTDIAMT